MKKSSFGKFLVLTFTLSMIAVAAAGCGSSHDDDNGNGKGNKNIKGADPKDVLTGSCAQTFQNGAKLCSDLLNSTQDNLNTQCHQGNGVVSTTACASDGRVGSCNAVDGTSKVIIRFYAPTTSDQAKGACQQNGGQYTDG